MVFLDLFGSIANFFDFCLFLSPMPTILKGIETKEIKNLTLLYVLVAIVNNFLWFAFGYYTNDFYLYFISMIGTVIYIFYSNAKVYVDFIHIKYLFILNLSIFIFCFICLKYFSIELDIILATIIGCIWQSTLIPPMRQSLILKNSEYVNLTVNTVSCINFLIWFLYGILDKVPLLCFIKLLSFIFSFCNIYIYLWTKGKISDNSIIILILKKIMFTGKKVNEIKFKEAKDRLLQSL